jgi:dihydrofolate reductase
MGRLVAMMSLSVDGFIEGPDADIGWHRVSEDLHLEFNEQLAASAAFLHGGRMQRMMDDFWPTADQDPDASPATLAFREIWLSKPKIVFSRTLTTQDPTVGVLHRIDRTEVQALKDIAKGDLHVGGATITAELGRLGLIDEYRFYVMPVALGSGTPLFPERAPLELLETRDCGDGVVLSRYRPA